MENVTGVFHSIDAAEQARQELIQRDIPERAVVLLSREAPQSSGAHVTSEKQLDQVRTTSSAPTGSGQTVGAVVGAAAGGSAGLAAGATMASLLIPGLGMIAAMGIGAAALLGLGGGAAGAKIGETVERSSDTGVSKDQVQLYHQLLQAGYSLVIADVRSGADITTVREVFRQHGGEELETARRKLGNAA